MHLSIEQYQAFTKWLEDNNIIIMNENIEMTYNRNMDCVEMYKSAGRIYNRTANVSFINKAKEYSVEVYVDYEKTPDANILDELKKAIENITNVH